jgi:hypothetical protein
VAQAAAPGNWVNRYMTREIPTVAGMVTTQAVTISPTTFGLTPPPDWMPDPVTDEAAACVVEHGRDRAGHAGRPVPGPAAGRPCDLEREVAAWQAARSRAGRGVNWRFTTEDARIKLTHLYPTTHD